MFGPFRDPFWTPERELGMDQPGTPSPGEHLERYLSKMPTSGLRPSAQVASLVPELKKEPKKDILRMASRQLQLQAKAAMQLP